MTSSPPVKIPQLTLPVDPRIRGQLAEARIAGERDARVWVANNPMAPETAFQTFMIRQVGSPPPADVEATEFIQLRDYAAARTREHNQQARWIDLFAGRLWKVHAVEQADEGAALLTAAKKLNDKLTEAVKEQTKRVRPYEIDQSLRMRGIRTLKSFAYPSGHTSNAYVHAVVLGAHLPKKTNVYANDAEQIAFSRNYVGAHFPSDVAAGAYLGAAVGAYTLARAGR